MPLTKKKKTSSFPRRGNLHKFITTYIDVN